MPDKHYSRVLGCMVGNTIGDAFGGVVEFFSAEALEKKVGEKLWVGEFMPYNSDSGPHHLGVWEKGPPRGTGTDDTRNNQMFVECVIRNKGFINSQLLAIEYIERYRDREILYPKHADLAKGHLRGMSEASCAYLGMDKLPSGRKGSDVLAKGNGFPVLMGLISIAFAGMLHPGDPEKAYRHAFELSFLDIGYAKDANAMMATMISAAMTGNISAKEMIEVGLDTDPFGYGKGRKMGRNIRKYMRIADEKAENDQHLINLLAPEVGHIHEFDPIDILGVPVAAMHYCDGDPIRTIVMAANDRDLFPDGKLKRLRDVDCTAGVAGALVGALRGIEAFPEDWVKDTIDANKQVYGIDLEANARRFCEVTGSSQGAWSV